MKEFKYIFKVDHTNPQKTLQMLGEKVVGEADAFSDIDVNFVQNQDFITAVPIEIALTTEMRSNLIYQNPVCRFIITGVPVHRIKNLVEYGYLVLADNLKDCSEKDEKKCTKEDVEDREKALEQIQEDGALRCADDDKKPVAQKAKAKYWVDGKEVSKESFIEAVADVKKNFKDISGLPNFKNLADSFFGW